MRRTTKADAELYSERALERRFRRSAIVAAETLMRVALRASSLNAMLTVNGCAPPALRVRPGERHIPSGAASIVTAPGAASRRSDAASSSAGKSQQYAERSNWRKSSAILGKRGRGLGGKLVVVGETGHLRPDPPGAVRAGTGHLAVGPEEGRRR